MAMRRTIGFRRCIFESRSQAQATTGSLALGRVDLLTVVMHEMGHVLGLEHIVIGESSLMEEAIGLGTRRLPTREEAMLADYLFYFWEAERRRE